MAMFRARVFFAGLRNLEIGGLNRVMLRSGAGEGATIHDPDSRGGDTPTSRIYLFPSVEVETVAEFTAWLQDRIQQQIQTPVAFAAERIDEETGALAD
jgi:hypothetical protein